MNFTRTIQQDAAVMDPGDYIDLVRLGRLSLIAGSAPYDRRWFRLLAMWRVPVWYRGRQVFYG